MRAGFVTSALDSQVDALKIMGITRHAKVDTLKIYDRRESGFDDHAGGSFFSRRAVLAALADLPSLDGFVQPASQAAKRYASPYRQTVL
jgi:hypothetical protein